MNRKDFLRVMGLGAAGGAVTSQSMPSPMPIPEPTASSAPLKHWTWIRGDLGGDLEAWRTLLGTVRNAGLTAVLLDTRIPVIEQVIPLAREEGIHVHAWMYTMMRGGMTPEGLAQRHPEWYAVSRSGKSTATDPPYVNYYNFLCPSRPPVVAHLAEAVAERARIEGLASIHLDYIRYPDVILPRALWPKYDLVQDREYPDFDFCYCDVCRSTFQAATGLDPAELDDPPTHRAWLQYRYDSITRVVRRLHDVAEAHGKALTAAVFPTPSIARALVRQDWVRWPLDAVLPMTYNGFYLEGVDWVETATREGVAALGGRIPLYAGLYVPDFAPADLARAAELALLGGANGIAVFEGRTTSPEHWQRLGEVLTR